MTGAGRKSGLFLSVVAAIALISSCASGAGTPQAQAIDERASEPAPAASTSAGPTAIDVASVESLLADAKALKKQAFDLKLYEEFGDDYRAADALFSKGLSAYESGDKAGAKPSLAAAADAFRSLIDRGLAELASIAKREAEDMRTEAVRAEAEIRAPDRLEAGDEAFVGAESLAMGGSTEAAIAAYETSRLLYEIALRRASADAIVEQIEKRDYSRWDQGNYDLALGKLRAEEGLWRGDGQADREAALDALEEAVLRLNLVVQIGRESIASSARNDAEASKNRSDDIKARVSAPVEYEKALSDLGDADRLFKMKDYEEAASAYKRAMSAFDRAYEVAAEKRSRAAAALRRAEQAASDSGRKADEADPIVNTVDR